MNQLETLEKIIKLQDDVINLLKAEMERLKTPPVYFDNNRNPNHIYPTFPGGGVNTCPSGPLPPWIVTSGDLTGGGGGTCGTANLDLSSVR